MVTNERSFAPSALGAVALGAVLVAAAALSRFVEFAPNFAAVGAAAIFAGFLMRRRWAALAVPLAAMALSDLFLGFYDWRVMAVVYASLALPALWSAGWSQRPGVLRVGSAAIGGGLMFFATTNLAVWLFAAHGSSASLAQTYVDGLPFLKYTLVGNVFFAAVFFGAHAMVRALMSASARTEALSAT